MTKLLLMALLALAPNSPYAPCMQARTPQILFDLDDAARATGVPPGLLLVVGFMESHLGCNPRSGGCWGAPVDRHHRHTPGRAIHAARALARGHRACRSWRGAVGFFRSGICQPSDAIRAGYVGRVERMYNRLHNAAGVAEFPRMTP